MSPQSPRAHTHPQPALVPTGHLAVPPIVALQGLSTAPWAVSLSLEDWVSRDEGRRLWGEQSCNNPKPSSPKMPWPMSQPLSMSQRAPLSGPSLSPFNDARFGQRLTISCHSISGSGGGGSREIPGQGRGEPFPSPICCHLLPAQSCRSSRRSPLCLTRGPAVRGGLQVTQQHVPPAPAPSAVQGHHILHQEGLDPCCVFLSPCRGVGQG